MAAKPTVAIGHPLMGRGGSEFEVLWGIQCLREDYAVTIVTGGGFDLESLNELCGTSVQNGDFSLIQAPLPGFLRKHAAALRGSIFSRKFRRVAQNFDLVISAYNPRDLGRRAIQCVADFSWNEALRRRHHPAPPGPARIVHRSKLVRSAYLRFCRCLHRNDVIRVMKRDLLIANSNWTAGHLKDMGADNIVVIHPPVAPDFAVLPWNARKQGFVCIGRIAPEKRVEELIEILDGARRRGHEISFCIVGELNGSAYSNQVRKLAEARKDWVTLAGPIYGTLKADALSRHRFGLHGSAAEAFGIGVVEMANAGCVTFVRDGAGPAEIVARSELTFSTIPEAVSKIDRVLREPRLQDNLRAHLSRQARRYSAEEFCKQFRSVVGEFLKAERGCRERRIGS